MSAIAPTAAPGGGAGLRARIASIMGRDTWVLALWGLLIALLIATQGIRPGWDAFDFRSLAIAALPIAFAAAAQAIVRRRQTETMRTLAESLPG